MLEILGLQQFLNTKIYTLYKLSSFAALSSCGSKYRGTADGELGESTQNITMSSYRMIILPLFKSLRVGRNQKSDAALWTYQVVFR